ncbi:hypothetical protein GCM10010315_46210 [Streptomyces luteosporeus]|uniref:Transposase DDE domain-containing protein n=1 Tax=Streptomyces luteosporeus TaxID=173856 RepID=A0ABN3U073_9ACTN
MAGSCCHVIVQYGAAHSARPVASLIAWRSGGRPPVRGFEVALGVLLRGVRIRRGPGRGEGFMGSRVRWKLMARQIGARLRLAVPYAERLLIAASAAATIFRR